VKKFLPRTADPTFTFSMTAPMIAR